MLISYPHFPSAEMALNEKPPAARTIQCDHCGHTRTRVGDQPKDWPCEFCILADEALDAFWDKIVEHFPEAKFGDLSPERTRRLQDAAVTAVEEWITNNVLPQESDEGEKRRRAT